MYRIKVMFYKVINNIERSSDSKLDILYKIIWSSFFCITVCYFLVINICPSLESILIIPVVCSLLVTYGYLFNNKKCLGIILLLIIELYVIIDNTYNPLYGLIPLSLLLITYQCLPIIENFINSRLYNSMFVIPVIIIGSILIILISAVIILFIKTIYIELILRFPSILTILF